MKLARRPCSNEKKITLTSFVEWERSDRMPCACASISLLLALPVGLAFSHTQAHTHTYFLSIFSTVRFFVLVFSIPFFRSVITGVLSDSVNQKRFSLSLFFFSSTILSASISLMFFFGSSLLFFADSNVDLFPNFAFFS